MREFLRRMAEIRWTCWICQNTYSENDRFCPYCN